MVGASNKAFEQTRRSEVQDRGVSCSQLNARTLGGAISSLSSDRFGVPNGCAIAKIRLVGRLALLEPGRTGGDRAFGLLALPALRLGPKRGSQHHGHGRRSGSVPATLRGRRDQGRRRGKRGPT